MLFDAWEQTSATQFIFTIPEIVFEASITVYTIWKGFRPSPILDDRPLHRTGRGPRERGPSCALTAITRRLVQ